MKFLISLLAVLNMYACSDNSQSSVSEDKKVEEAPKKPNPLPASKLTVPEFAVKQLKKVGDEYCEKMKALKDKYPTHANKAFIKAFRKEARLTEKLCANDGTYVAYSKEDNLVGPNEEYFANQSALGDAIGTITAVLQKADLADHIRFSNMSGDLEFGGSLGKPSVNEVIHDMENPAGDNSAVAKARTDLVNFTMWAKSLNNYYREHSPVKMGGM